MFASLMNAMDRASLSFFSILAATPLLAVVALGLIR